MLNLVRRLLYRRSYPLNKITISREKLLHNYKYLSSLNRKTRIAPVLKSNAYGHGIQGVGKMMDKVGAPFLAVDSIYEAYQLQKAGVKSSVLIMGYIDPQSLSYKKLPFQYAVYDLKLAQAINKHQKGAKVHVFLDTGMHREGVPVKDLEKFLLELKKLPNINIVGLMSHFAIGNEPKNPLTLKQVRQFTKAVELCKSLKIKLEYKHLGGTNAALHNSTALVN